MQKSLVVLSFALTLVTFSCAAKQHSVSDSAVPAPPREALSLPLVGRGGMAHACPVNGEIYTAYHVAFTEYDGVPFPNWYAFTFGKAKGYVGGEKWSTARDLAIMDVVTNDAIGYHRVAEHAQLGQFVEWKQYSWSSAGVRSMEVRGKVEELFSGHIVFSPAPDYGASGGCLTDEKGQVLGIVVGKFNSSNSGLAVDITQTWLGETIIKGATR